MWFYLGFKDGLQYSLGNQAVLLQNIGRREEALCLYEEQLAICRELDDKNATARSFANQALLMSQMGRREDAARLGAEADRLIIAHKLLLVGRELRAVLDMVRVLNK